jgi:pyrrolidone-carboxylate peptidase
MPKKVTLDSTSTLTPLPPSAGGGSTTTRRSDMGADFEDLFLTADRNNDGVSKAELMQRMGQLSQVAGREPTTRRRAETAFLNTLSLLMKKSPDVRVDYEVEGGDLLVSVPRPGGTNVDTIRFPHRASDVTSFPQVLATIGQHTVELGTDPGNFYCEHMFFSTQEKAAEPGCSILADAQGERFCGFLHFPRDPETTLDPSTPPARSQAERHAETREIVARAIRGWSEAIAPQIGQEPLRILLTGYGAFMDVRNNPTGDFVSHQENLDAAMARAFGTRLKTPQGVLQPADDQGAPTYLYRLDAGSGREQLAYISAIEFPVADAAIDPHSPHPVQGVIDHVKPHAVLSMGVADDRYLTEYRADAGGLSRADGGAHHDDSMPDKLRLYDNYSLTRGFLAGTKALA